MKKSNLFQVILFSVLVFISFFSFSACSSSSTVGDVVCDYGSVLCDVSSTLCREVPGVPPVVCDYLDLACLNLNTLCEMRDSTETVKYQTALSNIQSLTVKLKVWQAARLKK